MRSSEKDRAAPVALERWIDLQAALSDERKYPIGCFNAFVGATRHYIELTKRTRRSTGVSPPRLIDCAIFLQSSGSACRETFSMKRRVWNVCYSVAMIHISRVMNPPDFEAVVKRSGAFERLGRVVA
jgi:hypothetical protein